MANTIRWLHLTDLHVGMKDQGWLWPNLRSKFHDDLKEIHKTAGPWDLVLFTGDLVQTGTEYAKLDEIFDEIWSWFEELDCDPKLLAVPGNHDLQWQDAKDPVVKMLQKWADDPDVSDEFWKKADGKYRKTIKEAFADYETWWKNTSRKPEDILNGMLPGEFSYTFTKDDFRLGIVGLNTAFLQLTEKKGTQSYEGHLVVHPNQFHKACSGNIDGDKWADSHHACFLMTHHPPDWLDGDSSRYFKENILDSFCLHLCGHNHETKVLQKRAGGVRDAPLRWLGRSLFNAEKLGGGQLDRSHGYVAGELRRGQRNLKLQFMPRRREKQGDVYDFVPDQSVTLNKKQRTSAFPIPLRQTKQPPQTPSPPDNARVLFRRVIAVITTILDSNPTLRVELEMALRPDDKKLQNS